MERTYWHKQGSEYLFPDLVWSRPETKQAAGKLLIIGGNIHGFAAVGTAYSEALKAGAGSVRVILPDALQKTVSKLLPEASFAPSTPSGSFGQKALSELLAQASWADGVLIAGDLGRNSETAVILEKFVNKYSGQVVITKDGVDYFSRSPGVILNRSSITLVLSMAQLQQLGTSTKFTPAFTFHMDLLHLIDCLYGFNQKFGINIVLKHLDTIFVVADHQVATTKTKIDHQEIWRVPTATQSAVWWLQNPTKTFQALATAVRQE